MTVERPSRMYPRKNVGRALLSGNVYCGRCGGRAFASTACRSHDPNDRVSIYKCYNRTQHRTLCDGPTTYRAEKVDAVVEKLLRVIFEWARSINESELIQQQVQDSAVQCRQKLRKVQAEHMKAVRELARQTAEAEIMAKEMRESHQRLLSWTDMFDTASAEEKKIVASYLIKAVTLTRGYRIQIEFNVSEAQYPGGMEMG